MQQAWQKGVYAITDSQLMNDTSKLLVSCEEALNAGIALLQYRDKSNDQTLRYAQASALAELCQNTNTPLIINDDVLLAEQLQRRFGELIGVHLGQSDGSLKQARASLLPNSVIGATCHSSVELAQSAFADGASYLAFGRFFASKTKPDAKPASLDVYQKVAHIPLPKVAIGGIDALTAPKAYQAGADLVAAVHAIFAQPDISKAVRDLTQALPQ